jgi:hypothetical protein
VVEESIELIVVLSDESVLVSIGSINQSSYKHFDQEQVVSEQIQEKKIY